MRIAVYGGSFNPPHVGHLAAARAAIARLRPDKFMFIPAANPPHKELAPGSPDAGERLAMTRLMARELPGTEVSDIELRRRGRSYTVDTVTLLAAEYPEAEIFLLMGTDMLLSLEKWYDFHRLLSLVTVAAFARNEGELEEVKTEAQRLEKAYGARIVTVESEPVPMASTDVRSLLPQRGGRECLPAQVYSHIIKNRLYGARPEFEWLRKRAYSMLKPKRIPHVIGCEEEAVRLARHWGADAEKAAEAGILHDITKKLLLREQLILCEKYDIVNDNVERESTKLLHAKTGAEAARRLFGADDEVYGAIRWHTTGRAGMTLLEKVIYMADYIEPNRDFEGVDELRRLAYTDLDAAMILGLRMSLEDLRSGGITPHPRTTQALEWFSGRR